MPIKVHPSVRPSVLLFFPLSLYLCKRLNSYGYSEFYLKKSFNGGFYSTGNCEADSESLVVNRLFVLFRLVRFSSHFRQRTERVLR